MGMRGIAILALTALAGANGAATAAIIERVVVAQPGIGWVDPPAPGQASMTGDGREMLVPAVIQYEWVFHVPVVSLEHRHIPVTTLTADTRSRRWSYEMPALRARHIKLWDAPEFSCKYWGFTLPNECTTVWHGVYADVPVLVNQHDHIDIDVPRVALADTYISVDIPRWTWTDKRFRFSLPAYAPPSSVDRVRVSLNSQRNALTLATDEAIATLDRQMQAVENQGEDPSRLDAGDGSVIDLRAARQTLVAERDQELDRLAAIDAELTALATQR